MMASPSDNIPIDGLAIRFVSCDAGWITFRLGAWCDDYLVTATHLDDPFSAMMIWLEQICAGAEVACWSVSQEGSTARIIFVGRGPWFLGGGRDRLVLIGDHGEVHAFGQTAISRRNLVAEFYGVFRHFVEQAYIPEQWEPRYPPGAQDDPDLSDELLYGYDGDRLRGLRSPVVEAFLQAGTIDPQLNLDLSSRLKPPPQS